jgi:hypothetical protein
MAKKPGRAELSRLVDAYEEVAEKSLGMGDRKFHEIDEQFFDAIIESGYRAVIKNGNIFMADETGLPGELIAVDPAEAEDLDDPTVLNLDKN